MKKGIGAAVSVLLAGGFAAMSVFAGPLYNLNDIGTFRARVLFIAMAAAVYLALLLLSALLHRGSIWRMLLRQMTVTAGFMILLMGINQKTYFYVENMQPLVRAMDGAGLGTLAVRETNLSAPAATLLYLITRGPVYDMYSVKLLCVGCLMLLAILTVYLADKKGMGIRVDALFALCVILPQGFISAGCTPLMDTVCIALLAASLLLAAKENNSSAAKAASSALYGLSLAVSGLALYALPVYVYLTIKKKMTAKSLAASLIIPIIMCLPAICCGVPAREALLSLTNAVFALPEYAAGAPGVMSLIPRADVSQMPIDMWMRHLPEIDAVTNAQPYYTQTHFEIAAVGFAVAGMAVYGGLFAYLMKNRALTKTARAYALLLGALILCPGVTNAAWIAASLFGVYAAFDEKRLRLPAGMVIFAASASAVYPMTEMTYLPMAAAFALCLCALLMTLEIIPTTLNLEEGEK